MARMGNRHDFRVEPGQEIKDLFGSSSNLGVGRGSIIAVTVALAILVTAIAFSLWR